MSNSYSQSQSTPVTNNVQQTTTGASAAQSPTLTSEGALYYLDTSGQLGAQSLDAMAQTVKQVLSEQSNLNDTSLQVLSDWAGKQIDASVQAGSNDAQLLSDVLANNQTLAQNVQSGGATAAMQSNNYLLWGVLGLAGLVLAVSFKRKSAS
jgi:hypothetical protein